MALEDYKALFGNQFDDIVDAILTGGLTPQVEAMMIGTIDQMVFNVNVFAENINKTVVNMGKAGVSSNVIKSTLNTDMKNGGKIFGQLRNETKETLVGGVNKASGIGQYETYLNNGVTEKSMFVWVTASGHRICQDCVARAGAEKTFKDWESEGVPGSGATVCGGYCYCVIDPVGKMDKEVKINTKAVKEPGASVRKAVGIYSQDKAMKIINKYTKHPNSQESSLKWIIERNGFAGQSTNLAGMSADTLTQLAKGLDDVLGRYNIEVNWIGYHMTKLRVRQASGAAWRWRGSSQHAKTFQKEYTKKWKKWAQANEGLYLKRKVENLKNAKTWKRWYEAELSRNPGSGRAKRMIKKYDEQIQLYSNPNVTRNVVGDDFYSTVVHESWHQVDFQLARNNGLNKDLRTIFNSKLVKAGVPRSQWYEVSEYAGSELAELWAETGTALIFDSHVPTAIKKAFIETLEEVGHTFP